MNLLFILYRIQKFKVIQYIPNCLAKNAGTIEKENTPQYCKLNTLVIGISIAKEFMTKVATETTLTTEMVFIFVQVMPFSGIALPVAYMRKLKVSQMRKDFRFINGQRITVLIY